MIIIWQSTPAHTNWWPSLVLIAILNQHENASTFVTSIRTKGTSSKKKTKNYLFTKQEKTKYIFWNSSMNNAHIYPIYIVNNPFISSIILYLFLCVWWGLVVSLRQPRPSSLIERYVGRNTGRRCIPVVDIYTLLVVTTKEYRTATEDGTRWNCQWLGNPPTILPHFLSSAFLILCPQRRETLVFFFPIVSLFFSLEGLLHPSKGVHLLFFFYFRSGDSHGSGCWTKDTERQ